MERITIGQSRGGKIISSYPDLDGLRSYEEIFDAMAMLAVVATCEYRRDKASEATKRLQGEVDKLARILIDNKQWDLQMNAIGARSSLDVTRYARRLLRPEFKD